MFRMENTKESRNLLNRLNIATKDCPGLISNIKLNGSQLQFSVLDNDIFKLVEFLNEEEISQLILLTDSLDNK